MLSSDKQQDEERQNLEKRMAAAEEAVGGWIDAMEANIQQSNALFDKIQKKLAVLKEKEAKLDAAIVKAETLEKCYLTVFKSVMDKNSVQPQQPPAPSPARGSAPTEGNPVVSEVPAQIVALQVAKGFIPKGEELLSYPNAVHLGRKSLRLLRELVSIMDRKALYSFTEETAKDLLDINSARTCARHLSAWQKFGFIEKKGKGLYGFAPPSAVTTISTQPQEGSQPVV